MTNEPFIPEEYLSDLEGKASDVVYDNNADPLDPYAVLNLISEIRHMREIPHDAHFCFICRGFPLS